MKPRSIYLALLITVITASLSAEKAFHWPHQAQAAVCLTYDDSLPSQIDNALPQLNARDLKATFFLQGNSTTMTERVDEWRKAATNGHELASHSLFHPCRKGIPGRDWVSQAHDLDQYDLVRLEAELSMTNTLLHAIDGKEARTFAYPCGDTAVLDGTESMEAITRPMYLASRGVTPQLASMSDLDFNKTPAFDPSAQSFEETVTYLETCAKKGTVAIFLMHGVGGDYLSIDSEKHTRLLDFLVENEDRFWVATFIDVMQHSRNEFERLGWQQGDR